MTFFKNNKIHSNPLRIVPRNIDRINYGMYIIYIVS
jgi:hypothetical protein